MANIVVIPAHLDSKRIANKVLLDFFGKPLIQVVYERAIKSQKIDDVFIATGDKLLADLCQKFTKNIIITTKRHKTGSDRISEAIKNIDCDIVVNVQADEVFINSNLIDEIVSEVEESQVVSSFSEIQNFEDLNSSDTVKITFDKNGYALYFSRSIIPHFKKKSDFEAGSFYKHIGVYGFAKKTLIKFNKFAQSKLEIAENLEQLRLLENGIKIKLIKSPASNFAINSLKDYYKALEVFK